MPRDEQPRLLKRSLDQAKVLAKQADELSQNVFVNLALSMEGCLLDASAIPGDPNYQSLVDEINGLLTTQEAAAESQSQCWKNLRASFQAIAPEFKNASRSRKRQLAAEMAQALADFQKCLLRPRPIRVK